MKFIIFIFAFCTFQGVSQSVTNWIPAHPKFRIIQGVTYDASKWPMVNVPFLSYSIMGVYHGVPGEPMWICGREPGNYTNPFHVSFKNFPYDPAEFSHLQNDSGLMPIKQLTCRAALMGSRTNWTSDGRIVYVETVYDCGSPVTNLFPVVVKQKSKASTNAAVTKSE